MIPYWWMLVAWLALVGVFALVSLITLFTHLRYGVETLMTYVSTLIFIGVSAAVLLLSASYLVTVDWRQTFDTGTGSRNGIDTSFGL